MKNLTRSLEPRNLFRNVYFWLLVGSTILLIYVYFIAFAFLPRSTSEVTDEQKNTSPESVEKKSEDAEIPTDKSDEMDESVDQETSLASSGKEGKLAKAKFILLKNGGWVDSDDRKITVVIKVVNLESKIVKEIIDSDGVEIEIDNKEARIINSESYKNNQLLIRAESFLEVDKFNRFIEGDEEQTITIKTILSFDDYITEKIVTKRFLKSDKSDIEGLKILWKK